MAYKHSKQTQEIDIRLGARLREIREARGYTQARLADVLGVTFQQIQKYEMGKNRISAARLIEVCALFQTDIYFFILSEDRYRDHADVRIVKFFSLWRSIPTKVQNHFQILMEDFAAMR